MIKMPKKLDRCVRKVKAQQKRKPKSKRVNPYAVCKASMEKKLKKGDVVNVRGFKEKMVVVSVGKKNIGIKETGTRGIAYVPRSWVKK